MSYARQGPPQQLLYKGHGPMQWRRSHAMAEAPLNTRSSRGFTEDAVLPQPVLKVGVGLLEGDDAELEALDLVVVVQVETLDADDALLHPAADGCLAGGELLEGDLEHAQPLRQASVRSLAVRLGVGY